MRRGLTYVCFATTEELAERTDRKRAAKEPTGYYGSWTTWRDADPAEVAAKLRSDTPYVIRLRAR